MTSQAESAARRLSIGGIAKNGALAAVVAIVINLVLYFIGTAANAFPPDALTPTGQPIVMVQVAFVTLSGAVAGTVGYLVLRYIVRKPLANRIFIILALLVLIGMAFTPFGIQNVPVLQIVLLEIMHLVIGGALIYWLPRTG